MQVLRLFPSAQGLEVIWHSIVKIGQSLYNEGPGMDVYRPDQQTPVHRMFLAGSYTKQDYIDSMCALPPLRVVPPYFACEVHLLPCRHRT